MQATARIYFYTTADKRTKDNLCPVKLGITQKGVQRYYSIREKLKNNAWQFISEDDIKKVYPVDSKGRQKNPTGIYKDIRKEYDRIKLEAENIINALPQFSFNLFKDRYDNKAGSWDNVFTAFWSHIQDLKNEDRLGYASTFESTLRAVKEFHTGKEFDFNPRRDKVETRAKAYLSGKELRFVDITASWLKRFDKWMQEQGKSNSTIGIYMRNIRVLFNLAIKEHKVKAEYPFTDYEPKSASGRKMALSAHQIVLIANCKTQHPQEQFYRDLFMFSLLANGMNLTDLARLKYSNINGDIVEFVRKKTEGKPNEVKLKVIITQYLQGIIDRHGNKAVGHDAYIFDILKPDMDEARRYAAIKQFTKQFNKYIRQVAHAVGIKEKISSYTCRHSFSTIAKNNKTTTEFIKEVLGYSSVTVTQKYLSGFDESALREHSGKMEAVIFNNKAV